MLCGSDWGWGERLVKKIEKTAKIHLCALHLKEQEVKIRKARGGRETEEPECRQLGANKQKFQR